MCLDFPGSVFHQIIFSPWNISYFFTCCPKISGCLLTLSCSLCYKGALPNFLCARTSLVLGLSDRSTVKSPRTWIPALSGPSDLLYVYCTINSNSYCTGLQKPQIQFTQKYHSHAFTLSFQQCLVFCLLPHISQKKGYYSVPH